jgi:hypothetical protein
LIVHRARTVRLAAVLVVNLIPRCVAECAYSNSVLLLVVPLAEVIVPAALDSAIYVEPPTWRLT